ncbi:MAG: agmatine deiminase family protein [Flavobacteriales bacterium]
MAEISVLAQSNEFQASKESDTNTSITDPPSLTNLRAMAEWEELQALTITWADYPNILKQIVAAARLETRVLIITDDPASTEDYLLSTNTGGPAFDDLTNVTLLEGSFNTIWMRDYAANPVYGNEVDSLILVDWIYNRPRPDDDASPIYIANELGLDLYETTNSPNDLMNTGGNFMTDGFGTAFASELINEENDGNGDFNIDYPSHSESEIDDIMLQFMGINRYIKMETLPYDGIHHIDMHMKLVDEETLLVGEYPANTADGPQINANIEYVLSNFNSKWDSPYKIVRIPMPDNTSGDFPDQGASYRTYTNGVFVNNTVIFPTYREEYDTTAFRIWGEVCPGCTLVGIDCDNSNSNIIASSGAIHCITHAVGVEDPLLISHQPLADTYDFLNPYVALSYINHRDGISQGKVYWRINDETAWQELAMTDVGNNNWQGLIPAQPVGTLVHYYIFGEANTGKTQVRPMPAPEGYWTFEVLGETIGLTEINANISRIFPNPANAITCIELDLSLPDAGSIEIADMTGRTVQMIYNGNFKNGISKFFLDASLLPSGVYHVVVKTPRGVHAQPLLVK